MSKGVDGSHETFRRFWPFLKPQRRWLLQIVAASLATAVLVALMPAATRWIVDGWANPIAMLGLAVGVWAVVFFGKKLMEAFVGFAGMKAGKGVTHALRHAVNQHLARVGSGYYESDRASLAQTTPHNIEGVYRVVAVTAPWMVAGAMTTTGAAIGTLIVDARVTLLVLVAIPPVAYVYVWAARRVDAISAEYTAAIRSMSQYFDRWRHGPGASLARNNGGEGQLGEEERSLSTMLGELAVARQRAREVSSLTSVLALTLLGVTCWLGAKWVGASGGTAVGIWAGLSPLYFDLTMVLARREDLAEERAKLTDVLAVFDEEVERSGGLAPDAFTGSIRFEGVAFRYPGRPQPVYEGFDLEVPAGTRIALLGPSGTGKSTLVKLLQGSANPGAGHIRLDGVSIGELDLDWVRSQLALVPQMPHLIPGWSLRDQIALWDDHPAGKIEEVGAMVGLGDLVAELPDGWDTPVSAGTLSGGQIQRIELARALLRDASVFLIDEALKGLPARDHDELEALIGRLTEGRTVIWIAHDLPPAWVNEVVELADGRVSLQGTPAEVSSGDGQLAELTRRLQDRLDRLAA